ncbi:MAG: DsbA family protein [Candidatus Nomurabacteria bacterium]|nr:MAG: DsbA family protein [Candidatus Nomurabacteria bacterium]
MKPWVLGLGALFIILSGGYVGLTIHSLQKVITSDTSSFTFNTQQNQGVNTNSNLDAQLVGENDPSLGPADAAVTIVEFGDYQCPYCKEVFPTVRQLMNTYSGQIRFVFRDYPVTEAHPLALFAAEAGQCAWEQGSNQYWSLHDRMFIGQDEMTQENILAWARLAGVKEDEFTSCITSGKYENEILDDFSDGLDLGVRGTPTFFVNGRKIEGALPFATFQQLIEGLLE